MSEATRRAHRNRMAREQERLYREQLEAQRRQPERDAADAAELAAAADASSYPPHEQHAERCPRCNLWHGAYEACPTGEVAGETHRHADVTELRRLEPIILEAAERTLARASDVETSHDAIPGAREAQLRLVLEAHAGASRWTPPGLTDDEVSVILDVDVWRRCSELRAQGLLEWLMMPTSSGTIEPVTREARSGRRGRVSVITDAGRAALDA